MIDYRLLNRLYPNRGDALKLDTILKNDPVPASPIITQSDAASGFITRYFVRPVNDNMMITEIDKRQYSNFKSNPRFITAELKWKIVGRKETKTSKYGAVDFGVADYNRKITSNADLTFGGLMSYISDYLKYWVKE
jgi:hypothetical protein